MSSLHCVETKANLASADEELLCDFNQASLSVFARGIRTGVPTLETSKVGLVEGLISDQAWKFNPSQLNIIGRTAQNWR